MKIFSYHSDPLSCKSSFSANMTETIVHWYSFENAYVWSMFNISYFYINTYDTYVFDCFCAPGNWTQGPPVITFSGIRIVSVVPPHFVTKPMVGSPALCQTPKIFKTLSSSCREFYSPCKSTIQGFPFTSPFGFGTILGSVNSSDTSSCMFLKKDILFYISSLTFQGRCCIQVSDGFCRYDPLGLKRWLLQKRSAQEQKWVIQNALSWAHTIGNFGTKRR